MTQEVFALGQQGIGIHAAARAAERNFEYNEKAAQNADERTRALYRDIYSPEARIEQLKEAGLSPSLLGSSIAGSQGTSGAQGAGTQGLDSGFQPMSVLDVAQQELMRAEANKANAEADALRGNTEPSIIQMLNTMADTNAKNAAKNLTELQAKGQQLENELNQQLNPERIKQAIETTKEITQHAITAEKEAQMAGLKLEYDKQVFDANVEAAKKNVQVLENQIKLLESEANLNEEQANAIWHNIFLSYEDRLQKYFELEIYNKTQEAQREYWDKTIQLGITNAGIASDQVETIRRGQWFNLAGSVLNATAHVVGAKMIKGNPVIGAPNTQADTMGKARGQQWSSTSSNGNLYKF